MDPLKLKKQLLDEVLEHLAGSQGKDLKSLLDEDRNPKPPIEGSPEEEALENPSDEAAEDGKPKGIAIEKVKVMGKPTSFNDDAKDALDAKGLSGDQEISDSELEELLKKYLG